MSQTWDVDTMPVNPAADVQKIKDGFDALRTRFSGATAPTDTAALMEWADTALSLEKLRNAANNGWIVMGSTIEPNSPIAGARGNDSKNNTATPNTSWDLDADACVLKDTNNIGVAKNPALLTCNILTAGPAANGRDQAGAFSASSWVHFFRIWNGAALASLASASTSPTLPTGYTHSEYCDSVRLNGSSVLVKTRIKGKWAHFEVAQSLVAGGAATSEAAGTVSLAAHIPSNALRVALQVTIRSTSASTTNGTDTVNIRIVAGSTCATIGYRVEGSGQAGRGMGYPIIPNIGQSVIYVILAGGDNSNPVVDIDVLGYELPS